MPRAVKKKKAKLNPELVALWQEVLTLLDKIRELSPWLIVNGSTLLGVRDPVSGETDWCSVMGQSQQCYGIIIYPDQQGITRYHQMSRGEDSVNQAIDAHILQHAMVLIYNDRQYRHPDMDDIFEACGRRYRGAHAWPELCLHQPGYFACPPRDPVQLRRAIHTLNGLLPMFHQADLNPMWDLPDGKNRYWVSITDTNGTARLEREKLPAVTSEKIPTLTINDVAVARLHSSGRTSKRICLLDWFPGQVTQDDKMSDRLIVLIVIIAIDLRTGEIMHMEVCPLWQVWQVMAESLLKLCEKDGIPDRLIVRRPLAKELIQPLATALHVELIQDERTAPMVHGLQKHMDDAINSKIVSR
jgi:hypothetical protein